MKIKLKDVTFTSLLYIASTYKVCFPGIYVLLEDATLSVHSPSISISVHLIDNYMHNLQILCFFFVVD
jgi:hypothetical protein